MAVCRQQLQQLRMLDDLRLDTKTDVDTVWAIARQAWLMSDGDNNPGYERRMYSENQENVTYTLAGLSVTVQQ